MGHVVRGGGSVRKQQWFPSDSPGLPSSLSDLCQERPQGPLPPDSQPHHAPMWSCSHVSMVPWSSSLVAETSKPLFFLVHKPLLLEILDFAGGTWSVCQLLTKTIPKGPVPFRTGSRAGSEAAVCHPGDSGEDPGRPPVTV